MKLGFLIRCELKPTLQQSWIRPKAGEM